MGVDVCLRCDLAGSARSRWKFFLLSSTVALLYVIWYLRKSKLHACPSYPCTEIGLTVSSAVLTTAVPVSFILERVRVCLMEEKW